MFYYDFNCISWCRLIFTFSLYKINQNNNNESFSVNFPTSSESDTSVETIGENDNIVNGKSNLKSGFNLTPIFILLAMLVVAFEWILYKKGN